MEIGGSAGPYISTTAEPATATMGFANYTTASLPVGSNNLTAAYSGDGNYLGSGSTNYPQGTSSLQMIAYCTSPEMNPPCEIVELPNDIPGVPYPATSLGAVGGTPPYTWQVTAGSPLTGLILSSSGTITGTPISGGDSGGRFDVTVTDSSNPPRTVEQAYQISFTGSANCISDATGSIQSVYPNVVAAGTNNQTISLYSCFAGNGDNCGTLTLNTPPGVTQVGTLTCGPPAFGNGYMVQGTVNIAPNALLGTGTNPPQIGLHEVYNGNTFDYGPIPYYITQFCPGSLSLASTTVEPLYNSPLWQQGYRTGVGIYASMQAQPSSTDWTSSGSTFIWENINPGGSTCNSPPSNFCYFPPRNGYVGDEILLANCLQQGPGCEAGPTYNILYDQHYFRDTGNDLQTWNQQMCTAQCTQFYYCGNTAEGTFTINYVLSETTSPSGVPYTNVTVTKQQQ